MKNIFMVVFTVFLLTGCARVEFDAWVDAEVSGAKDQVRGEVSSFVDEILVNIKSKIDGVFTMKKESGTNILTETGAVPDLVDLLK